MRQRIPSTRPGRCRCGGAGTLRDRNSKTVARARSPCRRTALPPEACRNDACAALRPTGHRRTLCAEDWRTWGDANRSTSRCRRGRRRRRSVAPGRVPGLVAAVAEGGQLRVPLDDGRGGSREEGGGYPVAAGRGHVVELDLPDEPRGLPGDAEAAGGRRLGVGLAFRPRRSVASPSLR